VKAPIKQPHLLSEPEMVMQRQHAWCPGFGFEIPTVEFDFSENGGHRVISPTPTVDELIYGTTRPDMIARGNAPGSQETCKWYHLPANHLGWAEDLIRKIYENRSPEEQRKRDVILSQEPFSVDDQAEWLRTGTFYSKNACP
jgi:hypothetical protein